MNKEKENKEHEKENPSSEIEGKLNKDRGDEILRNMLNTPPETHEEMKEKKS